MWKSHCPEFWGGTQDVNEAAPVTGGNLRAIRETDEVVVTIRAKLAVE
jgi:hypothetical protein